LRGLVAANVDSSGTVSPGVNFKRDISSGAVSAGECEGSEAIPVLSAITTAGAGLQVLENVMMSVLGKGIMNTPIPSNYTVSGFTF
jgi:sphingomyelin phosphodiesterase